MRRSSEPEEQAQCTVAELLARCGESAPASGRRHRRAAEDTGILAETAAQLNRTEPDNSDRGESAIRPSGSIQTPDSSFWYGSARNEPTQPSLNGRTGRNWTPAVESSPAVSERVAGTPPLTAGPLTAGRVSLTGTARPVTDQRPRFDPLPMNPAPRSSRRPVSALSNVPSTEARSPAGLGTFTPDGPQQNGKVTTDHETECAPETKCAESGSPWWEWAAMVSQIGIGVVGGAALWLVCEWFWQRIPMMALVMALGVITGLVWIVRRVRRAEDLQTTVIAVLVGLFVTVSPAALLLVGR